VKIQIFSDLHADVNRTKPIAIGADVDVVAVAGDIMEGAENSFTMLRTIVPDAIPIVLTMGNHEYYHRFLGENSKSPKRSRRILIFDSSRIPAPSSPTTLLMTKSFSTARRFGLITGCSATTTSAPRCTPRVTG
jgi:predicted phosphodiesterase